ncbi:ROK family protein [soil metagenome]
MATVGVDLGGTKIAAALVDDVGRVSLRRETATPSAEGAARVVEQCLLLIESVIGDASRTGIPVDRIGIGAAGVIDSSTGTVISATDTVPGWRGTELARHVRERTGLPVAILNDVHAHALGECWIGGGRDHGSVLLVAVGTGVGGAYVVDGELLAGAHGFGGHLGHIVSPEAGDLACTCGGRGHLEAIASGPSLHAEFLRRGGDPAVRSARELLELVELVEGGGGSGPGDLARDVVGLAAIAVGRVVGGLINTLDPDAVIVGGGVARPGTHWWREMVAAAAGETLLPLERYAVLAPALGADSAIVGGARFAMQNRGMQNRGMQTRGMP